VRRAQAANRARLDAEYRRLVDNLVEAQQLRGGEEWLANPSLPEDVVRESMPGALRGALRRTRLRGVPACCGRCWPPPRVLWWFIAGVRAPPPPTPPGRGQPTPQHPPPPALPLRARSRAPRPAVNQHHHNHAHTTGNIRRAEHFIGFLRRLVAYLAERMATPTVSSEGPVSFLAGIQAAVAVDAKTLRYARARACVCVSVCDVVRAGPAVGVVCHQLLWLTRAPHRTSHATHACDAPL
jgi:hypothetical protein